MLSIEKITSPLRSMRASNFICTMGLLGVGLLWRLASHNLGVPGYIGEFTLMFALGIFAVLLAGYMLRALFLPQEWIAELHDNAGICFTSAITISGSLSAAAVLPYHELSARCVWIVMTGLQAALLITVVGRWLKSQKTVAQVLPLWLIPMAGSAAVCIAGVPLGYIEFCTVMFAAGFTCCVVFFPIVLYRLVLVEPKLPDSVLPTIAILVSAPAVLAVAWYMLSGQADMLFNLLTFTALFFMTVVASRVKWILSSRFSRSWWALTFPSTVLASALGIHHAQTHSLLSYSLAWTGLVGSTMIVWGVFCVMLKFAIAPKMLTKQVQKAPKIASFLDF